MLFRSTLKVNESSTVSGMVSIAGNSTIEVAGGKTVIFSDGVINTQNYTLTLNNSGTVSFPQNSSGIVLNNADGLLKLQGTGTVQEVQVTTASNAGKGIEVNASGTVGSLMISADTELNIANGETLSGSADIAENTNLKLTGTGTLDSDLSLKGTVVAEENLVVSGTISVANNSTISIPDTQTTLNYSGGNLTIDAYTLTVAGDGTFSNAANSPIVLAVEESVLDLSGNGTVTGAIQLDGCTLKASGSPTITGNITQSDDATIEILTNQTLSYSGESLSLGWHKLTLTGGGIFNNSAQLIMGDPDSLLVLDGITSIKDVKATANANSGKGIKVKESAALDRKSTRLNSSHW